MTQKKSDVYHSLKFRIITQDLSPGQQVNEKALMDQYQIGRTPLREVLIELQRDGLINRFPRSGTFVSPMDLSQLKEYTEIRIPLEGLAGRLATQRVTPQQLEQLQAVLDEIEGILHQEPWDMEAILKCDTRFHNLIYEASHNQKLVSVLHELQSIGSRFWHYQKFDRQEYLGQWEEHRGILEALKDKDEEEVGKRMEQHLYTFISKLKGKIL